MAICTHEELLTMRCGRGPTRGVVSARGVVCYGRGFVGVAFADNQQSLSLFCSLKKVFFFKGRTLRSTRQDGWGRPGEICLLFCFF